MMSENKDDNSVKDNSVNDKIEVVKNPKRVSAGKKGAEAKKIKAELKRKEAELLRKENVKLKQITKDDNEDLEITKDDNDELKIKVYKNYLPLCIVVAGLGFVLYVYKSKNKQPPKENKQVIRPPKENSYDPHVNKEIDPFEFN